MIEEKAPNISVNTNPFFGNWVTYLRVLDPIWLIKENELAFVMQNFSDEEGRSMGILKLRRMNKVNLERWYMTPHGNGFNGMPLIWPVTEIPDEIRNGDGQILVGEVPVEEMRNFGLTQPMDSLALMDALARRNNVDYGEPIHRWQRGEPNTSIQVHEIDTCEIKDVWDVI